MLEILWAIIWPLLVVSAIWIGVAVMFYLVEALFDFILWLLVFVAMLIV